MLFHDRLSVEDKGRSSDGYRKVRARSARAGVYDYLGSEVDPEGKHFKADQIVKVYRPADEVFAKDSLASFVLKPITDDHPREPVNSANWRDHARGAIIGAVKDGDYVGFDLAFMDGNTVSKLDAGKRELSNGYSCDLAIESGTAPSGETYDAVQKNIRGNHVALVSQGRAGPECRVNDAKPDAFALCDSNPDALAGIATPPIGDTQMKTMTIDGLKVSNVSDEAEAAITKLQGQLKDALDARTADKSEHDKALAAKDTEIDKLKANQVDQAKIDAMADAKAEVVAKGKALLGDKMPEAKGKSVADMRRAIVAAKLGDAAVADKSDDYVEARFDGLTADAKDASTQVRDMGAPIVTGDSAMQRDSARNEYIARLTGSKKEAA
ncbi:DUF2213 domain-containing protein [Stakelama pacifica]|uniref:DUF2213 domain-containing protein n=1 Tax=Stakelama pacifica TaxID=517720 RepID=A0A4R6FJX1_9SPHN|nr:DUF2213 domain-containing protein [Stakelama pacifica]TDN81776.1 hypothetical protein EV664_107178 [Stakelama pacifica]